MNAGQHSARAWLNDATGRQECLVCGKPVEDTLFGVVHQGEQPAGEVRRPHPDDAQTYTAAVRAAAAALAGAPDADEVAQLVTWALYSAGFLRRRRPVPAPRPVARGGADPRRSTLVH